MKTSTLVLHDGTTHLEPQNITVPSTDEARRQAIIYFAEYMNWAARRLHWEHQWSLECRGEDGSLEFILHLSIEKSNGSEPDS